MAHLLSIEQGSLAFHGARLKLQNTTIDLQIGDCQLNKANHLKYLSVMIDDTISWVHYIVFIYIHSVERTS